MDLDHASTAQATVEYGFFPTGRKPTMSMDYPQTRLREPDSSPSGLRPARPLSWVLMLLVCVRLSYIHRPQARGQTQFFEPNL